MTLSFPPEPIWEPLQAVAPEAWWPDFMWMGVSEQPDVSVALYKHLHTRDYLNIDAQGQCYQFWHGPVNADPVACGYTPISRETALAPFRAFYESMENL